MKLAPLLIISMIGYGCAAKKMAAENVDIILENQIEKRLPLYSAQKDLLSKDVNQFLNDQKGFAKEALPAISKIELDVKKVDEQYDYLNSLYKKLAQNFSKLMSKYMSKLDEFQQKGFKEKLEVENRLLTRTSPVDRMEKIEDQFETLFGTISDAQKKILEDHTKHFNERHKIRLSMREKLHNQFINVYAMDLSQDAKAKYFQEAFSEFQNTYPHSDKNKEIIKQLIPTLSKDQKEIFENKVNDLKDILNYYLEANF